MPAFAVRRDAETEAFFDGTARGEFLIVQDTATGEYLPPQFDVTTDPTRFKHVPAAGTGRVVSWSVVHERHPDGVIRRPVGIVELTEGPWWWTELADADADADLLGASVMVAFEQIGGDDAETLPFFRVVRNER